MIRSVAFFFRETNEGRVTGAAQIGSRVRPQRNIRRARRSASSQDRIENWTAPAGPHPMPPELFVSPKMRQPFERGERHADEEARQGNVFALQPDHRKPLL